MLLNNDRLPLVRYAIEHQTLGLLSFETQYQTTQEKYQ